ncbi:FecR family protein [Polaromonas sp. YR568]|uniref:FecR family protein n=1 Tax=Polaromonas sp. YR568 TaxID=1855301 RepID=UPI0008E0A9DD|nr:FecR domain-containing protein [Polaromonas sp. YR568]SFU28971.1 FecR family protein [Polaromonas sp. YR568]
MPSHFKLQHSVLAMALAAIYPLQASAAPSAGVAQFIAGDVNVRRADGGTAPLVKGKDIESGQAILTGASGRAQVRFTDGGLVSLQPNTEFKVANYVDKADPKEDRFLVDLLRGSMRAITGLIGKRNRENYKVTTTTATIGIRGSGFNVGYNPDGSLGVTTELDGIEVCNAGGCVGLTAGESVRVVNNTDAPVRTNVRANVPTPPAQTDRVEIEKVDDKGKPVVVETKTETTPPHPTPTGENGTFTNLTAVAHYHLPPVTSDPNGNFAGPAPSASVVLSGSKATEFEAGGYTFKPTVNTAAGSFGSMATNDFIGWGNWASATKNGVTNVAELHYLIGQATPVLPTTVGVASYSLVGGSNPTSYTGASGTLLGTSSLSVNFDTSGAGPMMSVNINTSFGNVVDNFLYFSSSTFSSASGNIKGMFTGTNATYAGLIYNGGLSPAGSFTGTAVFKAP